MGSTAYLVDKDTVFTHGLKQLLAEKFNTALIGQRSDITEATEEIMRLAPNMVFLDAGEAIFDSLPSLRRLRSACPQTKLIVFAESVTLSVAREMLSLGLDGYLLKPINLDVFEELLGHLRRGESYVGSGFNAYGESSSNPGAAKHCGNEVINNRLSDRETQILVRTVNGQSAAEIANEFNISVKTAEWHRRNVYSKLHVKNVAQLTKFALRIGLIALD